VASLFFQLKGKRGGYVANQLWGKHKITVQAIQNYKNNVVDYKNVNAIGIATRVFITKANIDKLVRTVRSIQ
jgi:hypothetical protein